MIDNELILITGGSGKLGRVILSDLLAKGKVVITTCTSEESAHKLRNDFSGYSELLTIIPIDLTLDGSCKKLVSSLSEKKIFPTALINNARNMSFLKIEKNGFCKRENFLAEYHLDVFVPYELSFLLAHEKQSKLKKIVNIGSQYGLVAANRELYDDKSLGSPIQYSLAKSALHHLTKELSVRFAELGISVNCVAYGGVAGRVDDNFQQKYAKLSPIKRMLDEKEVPGAIKFLISDDASGMTGHVLVVDGGWSIW